MKNYWDVLTKEKWDNVQYPYRPRPEDLDFLESIEKGKKVLLFGATPEIRLFFSKRKQHITIFDASNECVQEMGRYIEDKSYETYINADWLTYSGTDNYDYVLGDLVFNVIQKENHPMLKKVIQNMSSPTAKIFFRTLSKNDILNLFLQKKDLSMLFLVISCRNKKVNHHLFSFLCKFFTKKVRSTQIAFLE